MNNIRDKKEIAELEARIVELEDKLKADFPLLVKLFDRIDELQAREKVLVEALQNLVEDISKTHGNYTYEQEWLNAAKALANVRGEVK